MTRTKNINIRKTKERAERQGIKDRTYRHGIKYRQ